MTETRSGAARMADADQLRRADVPKSVEDELPEHLPALRAFARSLVRDGAAADDLVQDTLLKAWAKLHRFEPGTNMRAWLFTILRNTFYGDRRRAQREVADVDGAYGEKLARKPDHDGRLNLRDFQAAFSQLPAEQREALVLVGALQHSYDDAAEIAEVRVGTIKSRLNRGRLRLAELLGLADDDAMELTDAATAAVVSRPHAAA
ncbi:MAG: RNA polymerase sigma factor [Deinococcus-Thermus bacterium]|jgi:RNA polymerase sigma-70 factor (ECF subfamily)|nr:RNA polymerase sigma factor [Deinococcota bacterium]